MPEVFRTGGYIVVVYPNDHDPPHVHVLRAGREVRIAIGAPGEVPPRVYGPKSSMTRQEQKEAVRLVAERQAECLAVWEETRHG